MESEEPKLPDVRSIAWLDVDVDFTSSSSSRLALLQVFRLDFPIHTGSDANNYDEQRNIVPPDDRNIEPDENTSDHQCENKTEPDAPAAIGEKLGDKIKQEIHMRREVQNI